MAVMVRTAKHVQRWGALVVPILQAQRVPVIGLENGRRVWKGIAPVAKSRSGTHMTVQPAERMQPTAPPQTR